MKTKKSLPSSAKHMEVSRTRLPEGLIEMVEVDSEWGKRIGLTSDVFAAIGEVGTSTMLGFLGNPLPRIEL
jgi:hypothetical protein